MNMCSCVLVASKFCMALSILILINTFKFFIIVVQLSCYLGHILIALQVIKIN